MENSVGLPKTSLHNVDELCNSPREHAGTSTSPIYLVTELAKEA